MDNGVRVHYVCCVEFVCKEVGNVLNPLTLSLKPWTS